MLFVNVENNLVGKAAQKKNPQAAESLAKFVRAAHSKGLEVHALHGAPDLALAKNHAIAIERLNLALEYNRSVPPKDRLDGIQFDVEPYLLGEFKTGGAIWQKVLREYLDLAKELRDTVKKADAPDFSLGWAIPFWWDTDDGVSAVSWAGVKKPAAFHLMDILNSLSHSSVAVMAYRNDPDGDDGAIHHSTAEVNYAIKHTAPRVKLWIGQETNEAQDDPPKITFWEKGEEPLESAIMKIQKAFHKTSVVSGVAIHHFESYADLCSRKELQIEMPKQSDFVARAAMVSGTTTMDLVGGKVVVSIQPKADAIYRQGESAIVKGGWKVPCVFGGANTPKDLPFTIRIELKDAENVTVAFRQITVKRK